jgi:hypothetical protein
MVACSFGSRAVPRLFEFKKRFGGFTLRIDVLFLPVARDLATEGCSGRKVSKAGSLLVRAFQKVLHPWARHFVIGRLNPDVACSLGKKKTHVCSKWYKRKHRIALV